MGQTTYILKATRQDGGYVATFFDPVTGRWQNDGPAHATEARALVAAEHAAAAWHTIAGLLRGRGEDV